MTDGQIFDELERRAEVGRKTPRGPDYEGIKAEVAAMSGRTVYEVGKVWRDGIMGWLDAG